MKPEELRYKGDPYWIDVKKAGEFLGLADKTVNNISYFNKSAFNLFKNNFL